MFICIVRGFDKLEMPQYKDDGGPMFNICPCCGFQSGYDDLDREMIIEEYRERWIREGAKWVIPLEPLNWSFKEQIYN